MPTVTCQMTTALVAITITARQCLQQLDNNLLLQHLIYFSFVSKIFRAFIVNYLVSNNFTSKTFCSFISETRTKYTEIAFISEGNVNHYYIFLHQISAHTRITIKPKSSTIIQNLSARTVAAAPFDGLNCPIPMTTWARKKYVVY